MVKNNSELKMIGGGGGGGVNIHIFVRIVTLRPSNIKKK